MELLLHAYNTGVTMEFMMFTTCTTTGPCSLGLVVTCKGSVDGDHMECQRQNNLSPYWTTSLILIILGMVGILLVFTILIMALWNNRTEVGSVAKWISFFSSEQ